MATSANRVILVKSEKRKLKEREISNFKHEGEIDKKFQTGKIIKR
jgi:hypothetical protein